MSREKVILGQLSSDDLNVLFHFDVLDEACELARAGFSWQLVVDFVELLHFALTLKPAVIHDQGYAGGLTVSHYTDAPVSPLFGSVPAVRMYRDAALAKVATQLGLDLSGEGDHVSFRVPE